MSNHSQTDDDLPGNLAEQLRASQISLEEAMSMKLGATGRFPLGKLTPTDEGEIQFAVAADPKTKTVIINFGTPVVWLALPREDARALAALLLEKIEEL